LPKGEEMVGDCRGSEGYWSNGSGSKESRVSGMQGKDPWLCQGELFKRCINESGGSRSIVDGGFGGCWGFIARDIRHALVMVMKGAVGEFTIPLMY